MIKVVGLVRFFSIILFLVTLGFVYAYLPLKVNMAPDDGMLAVDKDFFFYAVAAMFLVVNMVFTVIARVLGPRVRSHSEEMLAWLKAGAPALNIYISLLVGFVGVINNPLSISASSYVYLNFIGPAMIILWLGGFIYLFLQSRAVTSEE